MTNSPTIELPPAAGQPPPGPPPRHHRPRWIAWAAALTAFALVLSLTLYLVLHDSTAQPAAAGPSTSPAPTAGAPAVISPSATPGTSASSAPAHPAPDGAIAADVLKNATLAIPPWPSDNMPGPSGRVTFTNGVAEVPAGLDFPSTRHMVIERVLYGDVDRDGAAETLAALGLYVQGGSQQLIAFDRDSAGRIITLGTVLSTTGPLRSFTTNTIRIETNGTITVQVGDYAGCCGDATPTLRQWRSYGWDGRTFRQVGGPSAFPVNPAVTETAISTGRLVLGPAINGTRHGTLTVTVSYLYGARPDHLSIGFEPANLQPDGTAWRHARPWFRGFAVDVPAPGAVGSATYTFAFSQTGTSGTGTGLSVSLFGSDKQDHQLSDANPLNNTTSVTVRTAD